MQIDPKEKKSEELSYENDLFRKNNNPDDDNEIESDGSASAFDETEQVDEDNFDNLSEK